MHYNSKAKRQHITEELLKQGKDIYKNSTGLQAFYSLAIYPHDWSVVFGNIRDRTRIRDKDWECLLGIIFAQLIYNKKCQSETKRMCHEVAIDYVEFIRSDNKGDPWKFILNMTRYFYRYAFIQGIESFGIDWRTMAYEHMGAKLKPSPKTYHSLFTNMYLRTQLKSIVVFNHFLDVGEQGYEPGVNDRYTLLAEQASSKKSLSYEALEGSFEFYLTALPSWNHSIRRQVCFYLSHILPMTYLVEKQLLGVKQKNVIGL